MLLIAAIELIIHGLYSSYAFYGSNNIPKISDWTISKTTKRDLQQKRKGEIAVQAKVIDSLFSYFFRHSGDMASWVS